MKKLFIILLLSTLMLNTNAQSALKDPLVPIRETIRYRITQKDKQDFSYQVVNSVNQKGKEYYLVETQSLDEINKSHILKESFLSVSFEQHLFSGRVESVSKREILSVPELKSEEIGILDLSEMAFLLRGFPFENPRDMYFILLDRELNDSSNMTFKVIFKGEDNITIDGKEYQAYKMEMKIELEGGMALFSGLIPKTYLWYNKQGSHPLLKYTSNGSPGSDKMLMEMLDYNTQ